MSEHDKPSRGEQLYEQTHHQRLRLMRTGIILQLVGLLFPIGIGLLLFRVLADILNESLINFLFSITIMLCGVLLIVGSIFMSELREPKHQKNKSHSSRQFHSGYRRKGEIPLLIGAFYFLYGVIRLITTIRG